MASTMTHGDVGSEKSAPPTVSLTLSREHLALTAIVLGQSLWLGFIMMRGWFSGADLPNLAYANGRPLDWDYLTSTLGGHFGAAQRLVYWLLNRAAPLEWWVTVLVRVAFQALTTVLLWRLFKTLVGPRPWLWIVLLGYAFSAYLVPGTAALNSGLGLGVSQACLVGAMLAHVRFVRERRLADAALVAVLVLVMLAFAQQTLPTLLFLPALSFVFLQRGPWRARLRGGLALWPGWLMLALGLAVFAGLYLSGDYNSPSSEFTARDAGWLLGQGWLEILGPALVGGPWQFYAFPNQWSAYADPPLALLVVGQVALVGLIVTSLRRSGWVALVAWALPVWTVLTSLVLVGLGRWYYVGELIPEVLRYSYYVPLALALGIVLAFGSTPARTPAGTRSAASRSDGRRTSTLLVAPAVALLVSSVVSAISFASVFWENPAEDYTSALLKDTAERGPGVQIYDTLLPEAVVPYVSQMHVSDLLALAGVEAAFGGQTTGRLVVDDRGALVPAKFVKVANFSGRRQKSCGIHVHGLGTTRIRLSEVSGVKEWFLQLELYQPHANRVTLRAYDQDGSELSVTSGSATLDMVGELVVLHRRLENGRPAILELESSDPETNFCLVNTHVGVPLT
ncbi:hypothetical protein EXE58_16405 [Nocardioides seonyuensis]|uniref:Glycosyltransferase RgtA/B/C/D-like domain-containing protein n=1 Tax=Nocardioides seonyuensis TaxID=2518371 RepID=A0A4P7IKI0_9ACTN|nr:hypothetical protein [Nocardioides seonyuensis]QBX56867.1 hypothetical protein EXE58_16405 [Nocardioides seonyuensis]